MTRRGRNWQQWRVKMNKKVKAGAATKMARTTAPKALTTAAASTTKRSAAKKVVAKKVVAKKVVAKKVVAKKAATKKAVAKKVATKTRAPSTAPRRAAAAKPRNRPPAAAKRAAAPARSTGKKKTARKPSPRQAAAAPPRRAIYIDVENTSSQASLFEVLESLKIDRAREVAELVAVGTCRAVGQQVGRDLAALGAQLVHSAPARGVRDWSDLWIAVAAGGWIARAKPGDILEIVSNDRAFDAVGDAAAAQGIIYHRLQHRRSGEVAVAAESPSETTAKPRPRGGRRGRRARRPKSATSAPEANTAAAPAPTPREATAKTLDEPHGASRDQMVDLVQRLAQGRPSPWVNLDVLESALKREGFSRPANSPRLVTRLRRLKDFEVDAHGRVRVVGAESAE